MSRYCVRIGLWISATEPHDDIDTFTDDLAEELLNLDPDADLMGSVTTGRFEAWVHHDAESLEDAVKAASSTVRCAGHAAGANTAAWPSVDEWPQWIEARSVEAHVVDEADEADHHDLGNGELVDA